ncbi:jg15075 [Pararge aegeria aegeria]|uniref:Jg15075 protein n=1 Tax=Pararge aegeria aegeria TaxID=348720 RepID=A0A8S4QS54_9NEOP|nr:jg15075 [Pararge aegeria aegeria]
MGRIAWRTDGRWGFKVLEWRPRTGKRSVSRPPTRSTDDIKIVAASRWKQAAQDRDFGTQYKRSMSSSGLQSVEVMSDDEVLLGLRFNYGFNYASTGMKNIVSKLACLSVLKGVSTGLWEETNAL